MLLKVEDKEGKEEEVIRKVLLKVEQKKGKEEEVIRKVLLKVEQTEGKEEEVIRKVLTSSWVLISVQRASSFPLQRRMRCKPTFLYYKRRKISCFLFFSGLISTSPRTATGCEPFLLGTRARVFDRVPTPFGILLSAGMNEIVKSRPLLLARPGWTFWARSATSKLPSCSTSTSCL